MFKLQRPLLIIAILTLFGIEVFPQCTLSSLQMTNSVISGNKITFNLSFTHIRNSGNKWVTIHFWDQSEYPAVPYNYSTDGVPNSLSLDGMDPQGTIVIDNTVVSATGNYSYSQAFSSTYQNDGTFVMATASSSILSYDATTGKYLITDLSITFPHAISTIEADVWSSQANHNQVVSCFNTGLFPVVILPVTGMESFKGEKESGSVLFSWTTQMERNNDHFEILKSNDGKSWVTVAILGSQYENGYTDNPTSYRFRYNSTVVSHASFGMVFIILLLCSLVCKRFMPNIAIVVIVVSTMGSVAACKKESGIDNKLLTTTYFQLKQVDKDGQATYSPIRTLKL